MSPINPSWLGLRAEAGPNTNAEALRRSFALAKTTHRDIQISSGVYKLAETVEINDAYGLILQGSGGSSLHTGTVFEWVGEAFDAEGKPSVMFRLVNLRESFFSDFSIKASRPLGVGIEIVSHMREGSHLPTADSFSRIVMDGGNGRLNRGWVTSCVGRDANNDFHHWTDCKVHNYGKAEYQDGVYAALGAAGWSFEHGQSKAHRLENCAVTTNHYKGGPEGKFGVSTNLGGEVERGYGQGGSFNFTGGGGSGCEAFFDIGGSNDGYAIVGVNVENSRCLIRQRPSHANSPITIVGGRFAANKMVDGDVLIDIATPGPISIIGLNMGSNHHTANVIPVRMGYVHPSLPVCGSVTLMGNVFATNYRKLVEIHDGAKVQVFSRGNILGARDEDRHYASEQGA